MKERLQQETELIQSYLDSWIKKFNIHVRYYYEELLFKHVVSVPNNDIVWKHEYFVEEIELYEIFKKSFPDSHLIIGDFKQSSIIKPYKLLYSNV